MAALDVAVANEEGKTTAEEQRNGEAEAVAEMCARLIGSKMIRDADADADADSGGGGERRACRPGDIALSAPTGSEFWRYEEALERHGIPVATQAGKGLFRRQEIQDLIAVTRVLADGGDTLALGALLRGPLVGLTEEELLDIVAALPPREDAPDALPRLDIGVEPEAVAHPLARDIVEKLQSLRRGANATTPHDLLSQAADVLRVRPILLPNHDRAGVVPETCGVHPQAHSTNLTYRAGHTFRFATLAPDRFIPMLFELPVPSITAKQQENSTHERPEHFRKHSQYNPSY